MLACQRCRNIRVLHGAGVMQLCQRRHWPGQLDELARHFPCTRCWVHEHKIVRPRLLRTEAAPSGEPPP